MVTGKVNKDTNNFEFFSARFRLEETTGLHLFLAPVRGQVFFGIENPAEHTVLGAGAVPQSQCASHPVLSSGFKHTFVLQETEHIQLIPESFEKLEEQTPRFWCGTNGLWLSYTAKENKLVFPDATVIPAPAILLEGSHGNLAPSPYYFVIHNQGNHFSYAYFENRKLKVCKQEAMLSMDDIAYHILQFIHAQKLPQQQVVIHVFGMEAQSIQEVLKPFVPQTAVGNLIGIQDPEQIIPETFSGIFHLLFQTSTCV